MNYDENYCIKINEGKLNYNGETIGNYIIFKIDEKDNYSYIEVSKDNQKLSTNFNDYVLAKILIALSNDFTELKETSENQLYENIKVLYNYNKITEEMKEKICEVINYTFEDEELGIYNDFQYYYFDKKTIENSITHHLKDCDIFEDKTEKEMIKQIIHSYMFSWLAGRYEIKELNSKEY